VVLKAKGPKDSAHPKTLTSWGDHIRTWRLDLGLLQKDVAKRIGVSQDAIFNWGTNRAIPDVQCILQIINFLGYCPWKPIHSLGEKLILWREVLGLPRKYLAESLGLDEGAVYRWETNQREPSRNYLDLLEEFFHHEFNNEVQHSLRRSY